MNHQLPQRSVNRDSKADYDAALARYGSSFRATWASANLRDRSTKYGLDSEYRFYRLASMVLHGSAGGAKGTLSTSYPKPVQRTGPSLQLCPPAYVKGLVYFRRLAERAESGLPGVSSAALLTALDGALELWPEYRRLLMEWDEGYWPQGIPIGQYAIMAVGRGNSRRWYIHDKALQLVIQADPPTPGSLTQSQTRDLDRLIAELPPGDERSDDWMIITVPDVQLTPRSGAKWVPETVVLAPKRERDRRRFKEPKPIDPDSR
jgi:hypothetical protein